MKGRGAGKTTLTPALSLRERGHKFFSLRERGRENLSS
jgi:hypothetical protein